MADTRCADPEYQLDVDIMMLEYLLYHATKAYFRALQNSHGMESMTDDDNTNDEEDDSHDLEEASRGMNMFNGKCVSMMMLTFAVCGCLARLTTSGP